MKALTTTSRTTLLSGKLGKGKAFQLDWGHDRIYFRCVTYCTAGGYDYAGLQYSSQCICSNAGPQGNSDESECTYGCAGDSSINMCGGLGYINIFHTDAHKTTIDDFGCESTAQDTYYQKWFDDMGHCGIAPGKSLSLCFRLFSLAHNTLHCRRGQRGQR